MALGGRLIEGTDDTTEAPIKEADPADDEEDLRRNPDWFGERSPDRTEADHGSPNSDCEQCAGNTAASRLCRWFCDVQQAPACH